MTLAKWCWLVLASLVTVVAQLTLADELRIAGVHPELLWVLPAAVGLAAGSTAGMAAGFVAGAIGDLFVPGPFGLSALVGVLVGYAVGRLGDEGVGDLRGAAYFVPPILAGAAGFCAPVAYALLGAVGGHSGYVTGRLLVVAALDGLTAALLVRGVMRVLGQPMGADLARRGALEPVRGAM